MSGKPINDQQIGIYMSLRVYGEGKKRARNVDYRHVINSLERKPQAFRYSQLRDDFLPTETYKTIWSWIDTALEPRKACKIMVGILALANRGDCEERLGRHLLKMKEQNDIPSIHELRNKFAPYKNEIPNIEIRTVSGSDYNVLIPMTSKKQKVMA